MNAVPRDVDRWRQTLATEVHYSYQPVLDLSDSTTLYVEALVRWRNETEAFSPSDVLTQLVSAEHVDLFTSAGLDRVLADLPRLERIFGPDTSVGLNLSSLQLTRGRPTLDLIEAALERHGADPARLRIEVVEDVEAAALPALKPHLRRLRSMGCKVMLDDFGTGASSLIALTDLAYDGLKIDQKFVYGVTSQPAARSVIEAIVNFGARENIEIVAEGVEDAIVLSELERIGCHLVQGFLFGEPVSLDELGPRRLPPFNRPSRRETRAPDPEELAEIATQVAELAPRSHLISFERQIASMEGLESRLAPFTGDAADNLRCDLFAAMTITALYNGREERAMSLGLRASSLAERQGRPGTAAQMLAAIATVPTPSGSSRFVGLEALARALQIRASGELSPDELATLNNILGATLANMGMLPRAASWWNKTIELSLDSDLQGDTFASINLIAAELTRFEDEELTFNDVSSGESMVRLERALEKLSTSRHASVGIYEALHAQCAAAWGRLDEAIRHLGQWKTEPARDILATAAVLRARAMISRAQGDNDAFAAHARELVQMLEGRAMMSHHLFRAERLLVDALVRVGRHEEAVEIQRRLLSEVTALSAQRSSNLFDWLQIRIDFDLQFVHLLDFLGFEGHTGT